jgi:hypothetical protein
MRSEILSQFVDQRIEICGAFDRLTQIFRSERNIYTALLQDVYAYVDDKEFDVGHVWIQHAEHLKPLKLHPGDRIRCECRVKEYKKYLDFANEQGFRSEIKYSLIYPRDIEVHRVGEAEPAPPPPLAPRCPEPPEIAFGPVELVMEVRRVAKLAGGIEPLRQLLDVLR